MKIVFFGKHTFSVFEKNIKRGVETEREREREVKGEEESASASRGLLSPPPL